MTEPNKKDRTNNFTNSIPKVNRDKSSKELNSKINGEINHSLNKKKDDHVKKLTLEKKRALEVSRNYESYMNNPDILKEVYQIKPKKPIIEKIDENKSKSLTLSTNTNNTHQSERRPSNGHLDKKSNNQHIQHSQQTQHSKNKDISHQPERRLSNGHLEKKSDSQHSQNVHHSQNGQHSQNVHHSQPQKILKQKPKSMSPPRAMTQVALSIPTEKRKMKKDDIDDYDPLGSSIPLSKIKKAIPKDDYDPLDPGPKKKIIINNPSKPAHEYDPLALPKTHASRVAPSKSSNLAKPLMKPRDEDKLNRSNHSSQTNRSNHSSQPNRSLNSSQTNRPLHSSLARPSSHTIITKNASKVVKTQIRPVSAQPASKTVAKKMVIQTKPQANNSSIFINSSSKFPVKVNSSKNQTNMLRIIPLSTPIPPNAPGVNLLKLPTSIPQKTSGLSQKVSGLSQKASILSQKVAAIPMKSSKIQQQKPAANTIKPANGKVLPKVPEISKDIFLFMGLSVELADLGAGFLDYSLPSYFFYAFNMVYTRFLAGQREMKFAFYSSLISLIFHWPITYYFAVSLDM